MPRSVLNAYERGHRQPSVAALDRIATAAGLELRVAPRVATVDDERAGRILSQVLELAESLPTAPPRSPHVPAVRETRSVSVLGERLVAIHEALDAAAIPHAFGGAIALAYCTEEPRGTRDIDVNLFLDASDAERVFAALPEGVASKAADVKAVTRDDQTRLWWADTPVDVFFDAHDFHREVAQRVRRVQFEGTEIPVLDCVSLLVFKAMFNRTRDWADIEAMVDAGALDRHAAFEAVTELLGPDDAIVSRLAELLSRA